MGIDDTLTEPRASGSVKDSRFYPRAVSQSLSAGIPLKWKRLLETVERPPQRMRPDSREGSSAPDARTELQTKTTATTTPAIINPESIAFVTPRPAVRNPVDDSVAGSHADRLAIRAARAGRHQVPERHREVTAITGRMRLGFGRLRTQRLARIQIARVKSQAQCAWDFMPPRL